MPDASVKYVAEVLTSSLQLSLALSLFLLNTSVIHAVAMVNRVWTVDFLFGVMYNNDWSHQECGSNLIERWEGGNEHRS